MRVVKRLRFVFAIIALAVLTAGSALAVLRIGELFPSAEFELSSTSDSKARCRTSTLTQEKFLDMVHAIINHADLTDKAFVEKTLDINFGSKAMQFAYKHIPGGGYYDAVALPNGMSDAPIRVSLDIGTVELKEGKKILYSGIGFFDLDRVGADFRDCQFLTKKQLDPKSEAVVDKELQRIHYKPTSHDVGTMRERTAMAHWNLGKIAKNGQDIELTYQFRTDGSDAIKSIDISQQSETRLYPQGGGYDR